MNEGAQYADKAGSGALPKRLSREVLSTKQLGYKQDHVHVKAGGVEIESSQNPAGRQCFTTIKKCLSHTSSGRQLLPAFAGV